MGLAAIRERFDCSSESGHAVCDFASLVLCNRKLDMTEDERIVELGGFRVILGSIIVFVHDE